MDPSSCRITRDVNLACTQAQLLPAYGGGARGERRREAMWGSGERGERDDTGRVERGERRYNVNVVVGDALSKLEHEIGWRDSPD